VSKKKVRVRVLRTFYNKYSKSLHNAGTYLFITKRRLKEINGAGHGKLVELADEEG